MYPLSGLQKWCRVAITWVGVSRLVQYFTGFVPNSRRCLRQSITGSCPGAGPRKVDFHSIIGHTPVLLLPCHSLLEAWRCAFTAIKDGMKRLRQIRPVCFILCCAASTFSLSQISCREQPTRAGWRVFVDNKYGFCFEYPPKYKIAQSARAPEGSPYLTLRSYAELATRPESVNLVGADSDQDNATLEVMLLGTRFNVDSLRRFAPTGFQDIPPKRVPAAHATFYYYGRGGGGVDYADSYFVNLRGRTLWIIFGGPYTEGNTPAKITKDLEPKVLRSFRKFRPSPRV